MSSHADNPDQPRIARVRAGDANALASAFEEYRPRLLRTVRFRLDPRLAGRVDPDDILQDAFLEARRRYVHVEGDTELELFIWLRLIALQTLTDVHRHHFAAHKRDPGREVDGAVRPSPDATTVTIAKRLAASITSPSLAAGRLETAEHLRDALDHMDPIDREILALRHFEELANHEAAHALGIEQKAASIRYIRALRRLKLILESVSGLDPAATRASEPNPTNRQAP